MTEIRRKVLFLDDEQSILDAIKRNLRKADFDIAAFSSPQEALKELELNPGYAVVVSDMRMPEMDGIHFLSLVRERFPETVRVMLTGQSDFSVTLAAINEGNIFRFISKPCTFDQLMLVISDAIAQHSLIVAERELLENTLKGSIAVLVDILSLVNPAAFGRAMRIKHYASGIANCLKMKDVWKIEVAAMLSQIGFVTVPPDTLQKMLDGRELNEIERKMTENYAQTSRSLICKIPRLEKVAEMIEHQADEAFLDRSKHLFNINPEAAGAFILHAATFFDSLIYSELTLESALDCMRKKHLYDEHIIQALKQLSPHERQGTIRRVQISEIICGMVLAEDLIASSGMLVVTKGQEVGEAMKKRLDNFYRQGLIPGSINIFVMQ